MRFKVWGFVKVDKRKTTLSRLRHAHFAEASKAETGLSAGGYGPQAGEL